MSQNPTRLQLTTAHGSFLYQFLLLTLFTPIPCSIEAHPRMELRKFNKFAISKRSIYRVLRYNSDDSRNDNNNNNNRPISQ
eukprot:UN10606